MYVRKNVWQAVKMQKKELRAQCNVRDVVQNVLGNVYPRVRKNNGNVII